MTNQIRFRVIRRCAKLVELLDQRGFQPESLATFVGVTLGFAVTAFGFFDRHSDLASLKTSVENRESLVVGNKTIT